MALLSVFAGEDVSRLYTPSAVPYLRPILAVLHDFTFCLFLCVPARVCVKLMCTVHVRAVTCVIALPVSGFHSKVGPLEKS